MKKERTTWAWGWYNDEDCAWIIGPGQAEPMPISSPGEWPSESKRRDVATDLCNTFVDLLNSRERAWRKHCGMDAGRSLLPAASTPQDAAHNAAGEDGRGTGK